MQKPDLSALGGSQLADLAKLLPLLAAMKEKGQPASAAAPEGQADPSKLLREIVRASFADDARGEKLRAAWKLIGAGALEIMRTFTEAPPAEHES